MFGFSDLSSRLDETDHPEYKIYRKTPIRLSILQRLRMVLSEDQRRNKYPFLKQSASKTTGEKLANPDYVDPQTLFASSRNNSQASLSLDSGVASGCFEPPEDFMGERVELDMSLNEKEVLREIDQRLSEPSRISPSDSYYESILDNSLKEEYVQDKATGKMVAKSDSFTNNDRMCFTLASSSDGQDKPVVKRPTKAPPPIPAKPLRLARGPGKHPANGENGQTSWVKAMVGRFE